MAILKYLRQSLGRSRNEQRHCECEVKGARVLKRLDEVLKSIKRYGGTGVPQ